MTKEKSIKQKLISAVLVLAMTFSMLVGTTFAWFTDSVSSAGNKIQVGTLKVDLSHKDGDDWISLKENEDHLVFDYDKWEPGFTLVESLKVENLGNLSLKYKLSLTLEDGTAEFGPTGERLAEVIDVYVSYGDYENLSYEKIQANWTYKGTLLDRNRYARN